MREKRNFFFVLGFPKVLLEGVKKAYFFIVTDATVWVVCRFFRMGKKKPQEGESISKRKIYLKDWLQIVGERHYYTARNQTSVVEEQSKLKINVFRQWRCFLLNFFLCTMSKNSLLIFYGNLQYKMSQDIEERPNVTKIH